MSTHWTSAEFPDGFGSECTHNLLTGILVTFAYGIPKRHALVHRTPLSKLTRTNLKFHQHIIVMGYSNA